MGPPKGGQKSKPKKKSVPNLPQGKARVNNFVANPNANAKPAFYERFLRNKEALEKGFNNGQFAKGRIYMSQDVEANGGITPVGYLKCEGIPQAVKVWGLKNLNRTYQMDEVYVKFIQWTDWGRASDKKLSGIDFEQHLSYL